METLKAWTIKQLQDSLDNDLKLCTTSFEAQNCKAIGGREIRLAAIEFSKSRRLSPGEIAIAEQYGYVNY